MMTATEKLNIRFHTGLTQEEKKFLYLLAKLVEDTDNMETKYALDIQDVMCELGFPFSSDFHPLTNVTYLLRSEVLDFFRKEDGNRIQTSWLTGILYGAEETQLYVQIDIELKDFFLNLKENPEMITFCDVSHLERTISKRLYYLITHLGEKAGTSVYTMDELFETLEVSGRSYSQFSHFKQRILDKAVKEINEKTDLLIDITPMRTGRKVTKVMFSFQRLPL